MQDEHESGEGGVGMLAYADTHGKCRESKSKEDPGVFGSQPSERARQVTGQTINVDGGQVMHW